MCAKIIIEFSEDETRFLRQPGRSRQEADFASQSALTWRLSAQSGRSSDFDFKITIGDFMEYIAFVFGILGLIAFVRVEKLVKTLKEQGVLDQDYKED